MLFTWKLLYGPEDADVDMEESDTMTERGLEFRPSLYLWIRFFRLPTGVQATGF